MNGPKILTPADEAVLPAYHLLFNQQLEGLGEVYTPKGLEDIRRNNTLEQFTSDLHTGKRQFVAHYTLDVLNGLLIESSREIDIPETVINWVMAAEKGKGIGTTLLEDCIARAIEEEKRVVSLGVSSKNAGAKRLYERLGFRTHQAYGEGMEMMCYFIQPQENIPSLPQK